MVLPLWLRRPSYWPLLFLPVFLTVSYYLHKEYHLKHAMSPVASLMDQSEDSIFAQIEAARLFKHLDPGIVYDCVTWRPNRTKIIHTKYTGILKQMDTHPTISPQQRQLAFNQVHDHHGWGGQNAAIMEDDLITDKVSGAGSSLERSQGVIAVLHTIIDKLKTELGKSIIKILDLPCGDHQYMAYFLRTRDDIEYTGADIVPALIHKHKDMYKDKPMLKFKHIDIVNSKLNESYDIILCRMMLQHLTYADVMSALYHFSESGSRYLIATTFSDTTANTDVKTSAGNFRALNLEIPPVNLRSPVCATREPIRIGHYLGMWQLPLTQYK